MTLTLTARQLRDALQFCNLDGTDDADELDTEIAFVKREAFVCSDGEHNPAGLYCHLTDYPEEGCYGPLGEATPDGSAPDHVEQALAQAQKRPAIQWPVGREAGRAEDMGQGYLRLVLDSDNDVCVCVWDGERSATVEFCNSGGGGGGRSSRTRMALIALMVAIEADNAERPELQRPIPAPR